MYTNWWLDFIVIQKNSFSRNYYFIACINKYFVINAFFDIASGAYSNSILFTIALLFLFALHWQIVKKVFVDLKDGLPKIRFGFLKPILKLLPILCAFLTIEYFLKANDADTKLIGTWQVKQMIRNKDTLTANSWLTDSLSFQKVYFDGVYGCAFSPNPYRYKAKESKRGSYTYDETKHTIQVSFYSNSGKADTMNAVITVYSKDSLLLKGKLFADSIAMVLKKQP